MNQPNTPHGGNSTRGLLIAIIALLAALLVVLTILILVLTRRERSPQPALETTVTAPAATLPEEQIYHVNDEQSFSIDATVPAPAAPAEVPSVTLETTPQPVMPAEDTRAIFREVLQEIHDKHAYQDISFEPFNADDTDIGEFVISDVDRDGKEELFVSWNDTFMAAMLGVIYGTDAAGNVQVEYIGFPAITIYSNGLITEGVSHNQGLAGEFWPYSISRYNAVTDVYDAVGFVDAWDSRLSETDYNDNPFPSYADTSGTGIVYYIGDPDYEKQDQPVDITEYEAWHKKTFGGANEIVLNFQTISNENIQKVIS